MATNKQIEDAWNNAHKIRGRNPDVYRKDDYGNIATIEKIETIPYRGATKKTPLFRLSLMAEYDNNFLYHVSCYETLEETLAELLKCSAGTFTEI